MVELFLNFKVDTILGSRTRHHKLEYLVRWLGYDENEDTWEPEENLEACPEIVQEYLKKIPGLFHHSRVNSDHSRERVGLRIAGLTQK